jgi:hypothetical protein
MSLVIPAGDGLTYTAVVDFAVGVDVTISGFLLTGVPPV